MVVPSTSYFERACREHLAEDEASPLDEALDAAPHAGTPVCGSEHIRVLPWPPESGRVLVTYVLAPGAREQRIHKILVHPAPVGGAAGFDEQRCDSILRLVRLLLQPPL